MIRWRKEDELTCSCGNSPQDSGFYPANASGEEVEPIAYSSDSDEVKHGWDGSTWLCAGCGAMEVVADYVGAANA